MHTEIDITRFNRQSKRHCAPHKTPETHSVWRYDQQLRWATGKSTFFLLQSSRSNSCKHPRSISKHMLRIPAALLVAVLGCCCCCVATSGSEGGVQLEVLDIVTRVIPPARFIRYVSTGPCGPAYQGYTRDGQGYIATSTRERQGERREEDMPLSCSGATRVNISVCELEFYPGQRSSTHSGRSRGRASAPPAVQGIAPGARARTAG